MHRWGSLEQLQSERTRRESLRLEREIVSAKNQTAGVGVESVVHDLHRSLDGAEYNTAHESAREASGILARMLEGGGDLLQIAANLSKEDEVLQHSSDAAEGVGRANASNSKNDSPPQEQVQVQVGSKRRLDSTFDSYDAYRRSTAASGSDDICAPTGLNKRRVSKTKTKASAASARLKGMLVAIRGNGSDSASKK